MVLHVSPDTLTVFKRTRRATAYHHGMFQNLSEELIPAYRTSDVNDPVPLYSGELEVVQDSKTWHGDGTIALEWLPTCQLVARLESSSSGLPEFEPSTLKVPKFGATANINLTRVQPGFNRQSIDARVDEIAIGSTANWTRVRFHLPNLPRWIGGPVRTRDGGGALKRFVLTYSDWDMTIDAVVFDEKQYSRLSNSRGYQLTHVGIAARRDSTPFSAADCESVLECLGYFLSFCRGGWTSSMLLSGEDENGNVVGEVWHAKRIEPFVHTFSWLPFAESGSGSLKEAFAGYAQRWFSPEWADALRISTQWYVESSTGVIEKSLILMQAALELLTWVRPVEEQHAMTQRQRNDRRNPFSAKLRQLLTNMSIPLSVPLPLSNLETHRVEAGAEDGPGAFTYIRNTLVHPNLVRRARLNSTPQALTEAWLLGGWYLDLCMLNILGYSGSYSNRTVRQGLAGDEVENVPWL